MSKDKVNARQKADERREARKGAKRRKSVARKGGSVTIPKPKQEGATDGAS